MNDLTAATLELLAYCRANDWAGHDPYDALNSRWLAALPFLDARLPRLVLTQGLKRSPVNVRAAALIPKTQNPKGLALCLAALLKLGPARVSDAEGLVADLTESLIGLRSPATPYWCWGYSFPWQTRTLLVPRWAPNLVCTAFVGDALLDAYEQRGDSRGVEMAASAADFMLDELYWTDAADVAGFAYPLPSLRTQVHNANLLGAAFLCRVYRHTGEERLRTAALRVARYSVRRQRDDGAWSYGEAATQGWIDNFHTGYNLCALRSVGRSLETTEFEPAVRRGFEFYRAHFFRADGAVRYFHDRTHPIDIHCVAQSVLTLLALRDLGSDNAALAQSVARWALAHMWDERGFFYYRVLRWCTIRSSFMRWSQAWMLLALATLIEATTRVSADVRSDRRPEPCVT